MENGKEKKVIGEVSIIKVDGSKIITQKIFGSSEVFDNYKIDTINFLTHKVVIKPKENPG